MRTMPRAATLFSFPRRSSHAEMPHADAALIPADIASKAEFWELVGDQLDALLDKNANWVVRTAQPLFPR